MKRFGIVIITMIIATTLHAVEDNAAAFSDRGIGPHATSMGLSVVSVASGSEALYWNPAGLSGSDSELSVMQTRAYETDYLSLQGTWVWRGLHWGAGYLQASVTDIHESQVNGTSGLVELTGDTLSYKGEQFTVALGHELHSSLRVGVAAKLLHESADGFSATGLGVDAGLRFQTQDATTIGVAIQNLIQPRLRWNTPSRAVARAPQRLRLGAHRYLMHEKLLATVALTAQRNRDAVLHLGTAYALTEQFELRMGYLRNDLSMGAGFTIDKVTLDFSWTNVGLAAADDIYRLAVSYAF